MGLSIPIQLMERIRFSALKGDSDLAMPVICSVYRFADNKRSQGS